MFDWVKSKCPGRNGKYHVSHRIDSECEKREKDNNNYETRDRFIESNPRRTQQHNVQVKVIKNKEVNIISPSVEIVEVLFNMKQCPIQNFLTSDDEPIFSDTASFKEFTDCSKKVCTATDVVEFNSCAHSSEISDCVLVDLIQFKRHNYKSLYENDSDSGRSSLSDQNEMLTSSVHSFCGHSNTDSRTSLCLSDSEYSFDSLCSNNVIMCENKEKSQNSIVPNESVYLSDNEYSFDSDSCLQYEPQTIDPSRMLSLFCEFEPQLGHSRPNFHSASQYSVKMDRNLTQSLSKSSVCLSDCNYSFDTDLESVEDLLDDDLPNFNPKIGFGINKWFKQ